jgi:hypothetical protein
MIKRILLSTIIVIFIIIAFIPTILSSSWGNTLILSWVNKGINGTIQMDSASFSWFGPQHIENAAVKDSKGMQLLSVESVASQSSLFSLVTRNFGPTTIVNLNAHIEQAASGKTNLQYALEPKGATTEFKDSNPLVIDLSNVNADFSNQILNLQGKTNSAGHEGQFNIEWDTTKDLRFITANIQNLPVALLDQFTSRENPLYAGILSALLGPEINLDIRTVNDEIQLSAQSRNFSTNISASIRNDQLTVKTPETVSLVITPELVRYFSDKPFAKAAKAVVIIDQMSIPLSNYGKKIEVKFHFDSKNSDPDLVQYFGDTEVTLSTDQDKDPQLVVNNRVMQADMSVNINEKHADGMITIKPNVELPLSADWSGTPLLLTFRGKTLNGTLAIENDADVNADLKFNQFPIAQSCDVFCTDSALRKQTRAVLGDHVTGAVQIKMEQWDGYVKADLSGDNGKIHANGRLTHGVLTLNDPFTAQLKVTPQLGAEVLSEAFPILKGILSSEDFVTLQVPPQGTQIQLLPFSTQNISIGDSILNLGKLTISSQGDLGEILNLLTKTQSDKIVVWFTPLYFNMQQGQINIGRMDMLIMNEYPIATWGKVNFPKDKVQMMIGFTPRAIENAFKLEGLPADYLLQIELKGTLDNAAINRSKALAKISALIASTQGVEGMLVGSVIDIASGSLSDPAPPVPTTNPLPWETAGSGKNTKTVKKKLQDVLLEKVKPF